MNRLSKICLGFELLLLALPVTLLFILMVNFGFGMLIGTTPADWGWYVFSSASLLLLIGVFLYCFWKLVYLYYSGGVAGLLGASRVLWFFVVTAMVYSVLGALVFLYDQVIPGAWSGSYEVLLIKLELGSAGLPVVVPALHLAWIYRRAKPGQAGPGMARADLL